MKEETKNKISKAMIGNKNGEAHKGRVLTQDWKNKISVSMSGEKHPNFSKCLSQETKNKISVSKIRHHIWYEDNEGNSTDNGVWFVEHGHHSEIHAVLRHNQWTDNRRYLAG